MKPLLKYLLVISSIGFGSLTFFGFIAYQNSVSIGIYKQNEILAELSHQILITKPIITTPNTLKNWLRNNRFIPSSTFSLMLLDQNNTLIASVSGSKSKVDVDYFSKSSFFSLNTSETDFFINNNLRYIWHKDAVDGTPYTLFIIYASKPDEQSFYIEYMGVPLIISAVIAFWVSLWGALILSNLFKRIEDQKKQMEFQALHDTLTKLPNRALFSDRLNHAFAIAKRDGSSFSICMLDLNRFKEINDTLGHSYGDKLLVEVSKRLEHSVRECDTVSRFGGDEFAIIIRDADNTKTTLVAERISNALKNEYVIDDEKFNISGSLGITFYPLHGDNENDLLSYSDIAMYKAKKLNIDYVIYNNDDFEEKSNKSKEKGGSLSLFSDLKKAIELDQFKVHYQPKLDVKQGKITSVEALLRWIHPTKGNIPPDVFIILAEKTGVIRDITRLVIRKVLKDQQELKLNGIDIEIAINLSTHDIYSCEICDYLDELLLKYSANSNKIVLEVTESAKKLNTLETEKTLKQLSEMGFIISIDDFGTGYSSLSNLQDLSVKEIKIDRSFVDGMDENDKNARIVRSTIGLAHDLKIKVVAEGAESLKVINMLTSYGCDKIQGYAISKPLPLTDIIEFLSQRGEL